MPWSTPTLRTVREMVRDAVTSSLSGAILLGNSVLRVMSDAQAGLAHLVLRYLDWLSKQQLPDTAESEWLDRHGDIWLVNAGGTIGRKGATYASGEAAFTGVEGIPVPEATELSALGVRYETIQEIVLGPDATSVGIIAIDPGSGGNLDLGTTLTVTRALSGVDSEAVVTAAVTGGADEETDDQLRMRVLKRIQNPPMGGDQNDYEQWALAVPGVTRAWAYPNEQGIGTVTVRFMMDDLRAGPLTIEDGVGTGGGFPTPVDVLNVEAYLNVKRPVAIKDFWAFAPFVYEVDMTFHTIEPDDSATRAAMEDAISDMMFAKMKPGDTVYRSQIDGALAGVAGLVHYDLVFSDTPMPSPGYMPVLGTVTYE